MYQRCSFFDIIKPQNRAVVVVCIKKLSKWKNFLDKNQLFQKIGLNLYKLV